LEDAAQHLLQSIDPYILAVYFRETGETDKAMALITYCVRQEPADDDSWAYNLWGLMLQEQRKHDLALRKYEMALALSPDFLPSHLNKGIALTLLRKINTQRIDDHYANAIKAFPGDPGLYHQWGLSLVRIAFYERAREKFENAIWLASATGKQFPEIYMDYGASLLRYAEILSKSAGGVTGEFLETGYVTQLLNQSIKQFQRTVELDQQNDGAYYNMGLAFKKLRRYERAVDNFMLARDLGDAYQDMAHEQISLITQAMAQPVIDSTTSIPPIEPIVPKTNSRRMAEAFADGWAPVAMERH
jgi:tetratricopeptide (TPR) repeat protein